MPHPRVIYRDSYEVETQSSNQPDWVSDFANRLKEISATQSANSIFDEINAVVSTTAKYKSVDEAVFDMIKRTGLGNVLAQRKIANDLQETIEVFQTLPEMKHFIDNYVEAHPGTVVDAVVHSLMKIHAIKDKLKTDDVTADVKKYINLKILEQEINSATDNQAANMNLGKIDNNLSDTTIDNPLGFMDPDRR